jgi:hypothetical protein
MMAIQPRMIGMASRRIVRARNGRAGCLAGGKASAGASACRCAHADFTKQKVWACTPVEVLSSLISSSTVTRQVMVSPSPCATMVSCAGCHPRTPHSLLSC